MGRRNLEGLVMIEKRGPGRPPKNPYEGRRRKQTTGARRTSMDAPEIQGYMLRWVNDEGTRIFDKTVSDDWEFVTRDDYKNAGIENIDRLIGHEDINNKQDAGSRISKPVGIGKEGYQTKAYLLKKKKEYFEQDYAAFQAEVDRKEKQLYEPEIDERTGNLKIN